MSDQCLPTRASIIVLSVRFTAQSAAILVHADYLKIYDCFESFDPWYLYCNLMDGQQSITKFPQVHIPIYAPLFST